MRICRILLNLLAITSWCGTLAAIQFLARGLVEHQPLSTLLGFPVIGIVCFVLGLAFFCLSDRLAYPYIERFGDELWLTYPPTAYSTLNALFEKGTAHSHVRLYPKGTRTLQLDPAGQSAWQLPEPTQSGGFGK